MTFDIDDDLPDQESEVIVKILSSVVRKCVEKATGKEYAFGKHPNIIDIIASFETPNYVFIVMNYVQMALPVTEKQLPSSSNEHDISTSSTKQIINIHADQLLNITITKTSLDLLQRVSALFNDVYNKRLPPSDDDDQPLLSFFNAINKEIIIQRLHGLEFVGDQSLTPMTVKQNESIPLKVPNERQIHGRLSVIEDQSYKRQQKITVPISSYDNVKWISDAVDLLTEGFGDYNEHLVYLGN
ncbi:unnamed protein product, partial [Rotaria sp. Silwood2]